MVWGLIGLARANSERNETLDTTVYAMAALHGLINMGLQLNEEAEAMVAAGRKADRPARPSEPRPQVIRSAWMTLTDIR